MVSIENPPLISVKDVSLGYTIKKSFYKKQRVNILTNINFDIFSGETVGIIGKNGAGKSSLLNLLAGTLVPDKGEVTTLNGKTCSLLTLGLANFPALSGIENILMQGMLLGYPRKDVEKYLDKIIQFADIGDWISQPVKTYSNGMSARLKFATAMILQADVILIDEVLGVGDKDFKEKSTTALKEKINAQGQACVIVSHAKQTIKELCTKVIWLENQTIKMLDKTDVVLQAYSN